MSLDRYVKIRREIGGHIIELKGVYNRSRKYLTIS